MENTRVGHTGRFSCPTSEMLSQHSTHSKNSAAQAGCSGGGLTRFFFFGPKIPLLGGWGVRPKKKSPKCPIRHRNFLPFVVNFHFGSQRPTLGGDSDWLFSKAGD